jgi:hypothetical protein
VYKKVVGVFVRFRAPLHQELPLAQHSVNIHGRQQLAFLLDVELSTPTKIGISIY